MALSPVFELQPINAVPHSELFILVIFGFTILTLIFRAVTCRLHHIPGPFHSRFTGIGVIFAAIQGKRVYELDRLHKRYGPIVRITPNEVSVGDSRLYRKIYVDSKVLTKDPGFYEGAKFVGHGNIFQFINVAEHAGRRKLSAPPYSFQKISALEPIIRRKAAGLVERIMAASKLGTAVEVFSLCGLYSLEVICETAFAKDLAEGVDPGAVSKHAQALMQDMDASAFTLIIDGVFPWFNSPELKARLPGFIGNSYRHLASWERKVREMVDHLLQCESEKQEQHILTPLLHGTDSFLGRKLTHEELVSEAMGIMFAGSGTTSTTLTYLLYALARSPVHQQRLREEVQQLQPGDTIALRSNPYINALIKETFRLYPTIISTLPRALGEDLQIGEYKLAAKTVVGMQNYIHHRQPDIFFDPDVFIPERWLDSTPEMEAALTPFSIGRRNCIGQNLAWEELYLALDAIVQAGFVWTLGAEMDPGEMAMEDRFNMAPRGRRLLLAMSVTHV